MMPDVLQQAPTGRAKCRGCGQAIEKGELRFGESAPNPYGEGEALSWFHLLCAACMRPEHFLPALSQTDQAIPEREFLERCAELGKAHHRLPRLARAERSPSNRAHCRYCREVMDKNAWRLALQMFEEGRFTPIGFIHVECAERYFGTRDIVERVARLSSKLSDSDLREIAELLTRGPFAEPPPLETGEEVGPAPLAKTRPSELSPQGRAGSSKSS